MARSTSSTVATPGASIDAVPGRSLVAQPAHLAASGPVDQEPARLRRAAVRPAAVRPGRCRRRDRGVRRSSARCRASCTWSTTSLDRESDRQHPLKARRPIASGALSGAAGASATAAMLGVVGARRRLRARLPIRRRRGGLPGAAGALLRAAEAHRHHRRADDRDRLRAARGGRRGGDRRRDQPLAARLHDPAGAVHRAGEAAARAGAARRRRDQPSADSRRVQRRTCSIR